MPKLACSICKKEIRHFKKYLEMDSLSRNTDYAPAAESRLLSCWKNMTLRPSPKSLVLQEDAASSRDSDKLSDSSRPYSSAVL